MPALLLLCFGRGGGCGGFLTRVWFLGGGRRGGGRGARVCGGLTSVTHGVIHQLNLNESGAGAAISHITTRNNATTALLYVLY